MLTPRLHLPLLAAAQAQKHVTHNEALLLIDALAQLTLKSRDLAAPPSSPADGAAYAVPAGAGGGWSGHDGEIALRQDGAWTFLPPAPGWLAWLEDESRLVVHDGAAWQDAIALSDLPHLGIGTAADSATKLAVASPGSLFTHAGAGHRLAVNKAAAEQTASVIFQTGFEGHAEMGLAGDDDFHLKVSPDGAAWREALTIERATGRVATPLTPLPENLVVNGDFRINQRRFTGGALAGGAFGHDRWKAAADGAAWTAADGAVSLASGTMVQLIEPALSGRANLANLAVTISVEEPSADLAVSFGSASGTIAGGSGRRSLTLTTGPGDTGNLALRIAATGSGEVSFARVKLEPGRSPTPWTSRRAPDELALCQRYYVEFGNPLDTYHYFGNVVMRSAELGVLCLALPQTMRDTPALSATGTFVTLNSGYVPTSAVMGRFNGNFAEIYLMFSGAVAGTAWPLYANNDTAACLRRGPARWRRSVVRLWRIRSTVVRSTCGSPSSGLAQ